MKALSIRQPWAWLIASGIKDVENRGWWTAFRGRIYIHAGKVMDEVAYLDIVSNKAEYGVELPEHLDFGCIIGEVDIVDCIFRKPLQIGLSRWHETGRWGFILANPALYDHPVSCKGQLGFFEVDRGETEYSEVFRDS